MLRIVVLGRPRVEIDGRELQFKTEQALEIFVWLALHAPEVSDRRAIADALRPGEPPELALKYLRDNLYFARQAAGSGAIEAHGRGLRLSAETTSDWAEFWSLASAKEDDPAAERKRLEAVCRFAGTMEAARANYPWSANFYAKASAAIESARASLARLDNAPDDRHPAQPSIDARRRPPALSVLAIYLAVIAMAAAAILALLPRLKPTPDDPWLVFADQLWDASYGSNEDAMLPVFKSNAGTMVDLMRSRLATQPHDTLSMAGAVYHFVDLDSALSPQIGTSYWSCLEQAIKRCTSCRDRAMARALIAGAFHQQDKNPRLALDQARKAEEIARFCGDAWLEADAVRMEGYVTPADPERVRIYRRALAMFRRQGSLKGEALCELCAGMLETRQGGAVRAAQLFHRLGNNWGYEFALTYARAQARDIGRDPAFDPYRSALDDLLAGHSLLRFQDHDLAAARLDLVDALKQALINDDEARTFRDLYGLMQIIRGNGTVEEIFRTIWPGLPDGPYTNQGLIETLNAPVVKRSFRDQRARSRLLAYVTSIAPTIG